MVFGGGMPEGGALFFWSAMKAHFDAQAAKGGKP